MPVNIRKKNDKKGLTSPHTYLTSCCRNIMPPHNVDSMLVPVISENESMQYKKNTSKSLYTSKYCVENSNYM